MRSSLGRAVAAAAGLMTLLAPTAASASWWDGGYGPARRHSPPPTTTTTNYNQPPDQNPPPTTTTTGYNSPPPPTTAPAPAPAPPPPAPVGSIYGCENSTLPDTELLLQKTTTPPPGTPVRPGDEIVVEITWRVTDWLAPDLHKALDCVYLNGRYLPGLSGGERPTPNDGHFAYRYVVPVDAPPGSTICDQGFVSGPNGSGEYGREVSNVVCFPIEQPPPSAAPAPMTTTTTAPPQPQRAGLEAPGEAPTRAPSAAPTAPKVLPRDVLPRTGADANPARLAAGAL